MLLARWKVLSRPQIQEQGSGLKKDHTVLSVELARSAHSPLTFGNYYLYLKLYVKTGAYWALESSYPGNPQIYFIPDIPIGMGAIFQIVSTVLQPKYVMLYNPAVSLGQDRLELFLPRLLAHFSEI